MSLRISAETAQDPDVEASRAELEIIEGQKKAAQSDVISIAENKKQVEAEKSEMSAKLDADIADRQEASRQAAEAHNALIATYDSQRTEAEAARNAAQAQAAQAQKERDMAQKESAEKIEWRDSLNASIPPLEKKASDLKSSIESLAREHDKHVEREARAKQAAYSAEMSLAGLNAAHAHTVIEYDAEKREHEVLAATKAEKERQNVRLGESIAEKTQQESTLNESIAALSKKSNEHETLMRNREDKANERLANATRLESRVDAKLAQLKEAEKEMTTEHLSRIGYKPIGT